MKKILALLILAVTLRADISGPTPSQVINGAPLGALTGSLTYALNNALTGTSSTTIDLNGYTGIMLTVTMTGTGLVDIVQSNLNVTYGAQVYSVQVPSTYPIRMEGRYLTIRSNPNNKPTYRMSAFYYPVAAPATTISGGSITVAGSVTVTALPVYNPSGITQYTALSQTATDVNLTNTAAAAVPCIVCLSSNGGAAAGFKFFFGANGASTTNLIAGQGHYIAASSTAQCWGPFVSGTHFYAVGVAASSSVLVDVQKVQAQ